MTGVLTAPPRRAALPPAVLARPRLEALLDSDHPLTMVTGPAGAGKTVLLGAFAAAHDAAWLSLLPRHNDPAGLADAIDAALAAAAPAARQTLVLDDLHHVRGPALDVIRQLLADEEDGPRLVIASRADPDLGLARLRLEGRLLELRGRRSGVHRGRGDGDAAAWSASSSARHTSSGSWRGPRAGRRACGWRRCRRCMRPTRSASSRSSRGTTARSPTT